MSEQLFRVSEVAELASCGRSTVYRAIGEGRLP
jgi:excisionase family DNA binding protein